MDSILKAFYMFSTSLIDEKHLISSFKQARKIVKATKTTEIN